MEEDFEINKQILFQENIRKKESQKIIIQSNRQRKIIEADCEVFDKQNDPNHWK